MDLIKDGALIVIVGRDHSKFSDAEMEYLKKEAVTNGFDICEYKSYKDLPPDLLKIWETDRYTEPKFKNPQEPILHKKKKHPFAPGPELKRRNFKKGR